MRVHESVACDAEQNVSSFEEIYRAQWAPMTRLALLMTGSRETAEDLVHDAFLRLEGALASVEDPVGYLRRIVVNGVYGRHRREKVERSHRAGPAAPVFNPEIDEIWSIVQHLPPRQCQAVILRFYGDHTFDEIAALLDCPTGTAKSLVHRALERLRQELET